MLNGLYEAIAKALVGIHRALQPVFGVQNGYGWALSIVLLVMAVRLLLFPLFKRQIKAQRTMQAMQPQIKEIREKYKYDKQEMNKQLVALQQEHGNPLLGCLPIVVQIPLFISLFRVLSQVEPKGCNPALTADGVHATTCFGASGHLVQFVAGHGLSASTIATIAKAKIFGAPLASTFLYTGDKLTNLGVTSEVVVKIVCAIAILLAAFATYFMQRQIMARNGPADGQVATQQKVLLYLSPVLIAVFGIRFPLGVGIYYVTTNLWTFGQQHFYIRKLEPVTPLAGKARPDAGGSAGGSAKPQLTKPPAPGTGTGGRGGTGGGARPAATGGGASGSGPPGGGATGGQRPQSKPGANRPQKRRGKGQRKGGRH